MYYYNYYVIGQIVEVSNPQQNMSTYELKEREVKMFWPKYNPETAEFLASYETVGFLVVRGDAEKIFFKYAFDKEKSKVVYSHYRRKIPNVSCGTIFNCHRTMVESGEFDSEFSKPYFFLPSVTDRSEEINQYLKNVNISPIDINYGQLNAWSAESNFNPAKLDQCGEK